MVDSGNFIFTLPELIAVDGRGKGYDKNSHLGVKVNKWAVQSDITEHSILTTAIKQI